MEGSRHHVGSTVAVRRAFIVVPLVVRIHFVSSVPFVAYFDTMTSDNCVLQATKPLHLIFPQRQSFLAVFLVLLCLHVVTKFECCIEVLFQVLKCQRLICVKDVAVHGSILHWLSCIHCSVRCDCWLCLRPAVTNASLRLYFSMLALQADLRRCCAATASADSGLDLH